jgi:hypothetical protein
MLDAPHCTVPLVSDLAELYSEPRDCHHQKIITPTTGVSLAGDGNLSFRHAGQDLP